MKTIEYKSDTRGAANHGWLNAKHTFSFANYYDPSRMHFGALRVFNDDIVQGGTGFGKHPHDNMEIVTLVLDGRLRHKDSTGHEGVISPGEVQFMSAGTGVYHSEMNASEKEQVNLLQTWVFPKKRDIEPRYGQKKFDFEGQKNSLVEVVSPDGNAPSLTLNQDAWYHVGYFDKQTELSYELHGSGNGVFAFVIEGQAEIAGKKLEKRDALGVSETNDILLKVSENTRLLLIEVPMKF
ncbi:pirin family protein [Roseivirga sp. BDSF3-8]|uniref:pirin family protein n=1 Tax=Roseivirga sp. BDSF3-8 TaxID=3241598 RepID=UPI00353216D5